MSDDSQKSEFNMAVSYLARLNSLFYICDEAAMNLDAHQWFHALLALYRELITEFKPDEIKKIDTDVARINHALNVRNRSPTSMNEVSSELYMELHNFDILIRKVLERAGLQKKMIDDARKALR